MLKKNKFTSVARPLLLLGMLTVFLLLFSYSTSPLTADCTSSDSTFFMLVGKGMTKGYMPYRDFFDMKGPYLFFIEYIGQLISYGRNGIFAVQILFMFITLYFFDKSYRLVMKKENLFLEIVMLGTMLVLGCGTIQEGNLCEEINMPFLSVCLYMALYYFKKCDNADEVPAHSKLCAAFYGFAFGVTALIRVTNAAVIGAILLTMTIYLLVNKKIAELLKNAAAFLAGFAVAVVPMLLYYYSLGLLKDMLYSVFVFGYMYSNEHDFLYIFKRAIDLGDEYKINSAFWDFLAVFSPLFALIFTRCKDYKYWIFSISNIILITAVVFMGNGYFHYITLAWINVVLAFWLVLNKYDSVRNWKPILAIAVICVMTVVSLYSGNWYVRRNLLLLESDFKGEDLSYSENVSQYIPEDERDQVYCYFTHCSSWYDATGIFPCYKYCDWQAHYVKISKDIYIEIKDKLENDPPKWLITKKDYDYSNSDFLDEVLEKNYSFTAEDEVHILYKAKN